MNPFTKAYNSDRTDDELIRRTLNGDREAIDELLRKHQAYIYNVAWKMVQNPDAAADLTQEVMIKIITNLGKFNFKSTFRTWAYRIVVNHFLNEKKKGNLIFLQIFSQSFHTYLICLSKEQTKNNRHASKKRNHCKQIYK